LGCMSTYRSSPNSSLTQYPSAFPQVAVDGYEIFGLTAKNAKKEPDFFFAFFVFFVVNFL
ncbi:MAG: hypothetical protein WCO92_05485, partial [Verrucomicrobiota bacterium]